jgi:hypothetical protein
VGPASGAAAMFAMLCGSLQASARPAGMSAVRTRLCMCVCVCVCVRACVVVRVRLRTPESVSRAFWGMQGDKQCVCMCDRVCARADLRSSSANSIVNTPPSLPPPLALLPQQALR